MVSREFRHVERDAGLEPRYIIRREQEKRLFTASYSSPTVIIVCLKSSSIFRREIDFLPVQGAL